MPNSPLAPLNGLHPWDNLSPSLLSPDNIDNQEHALGTLEDPLPDMYDSGERIYENDDVYLHYSPSAGPRDYLSDSNVSAEQEDDPEPSPPKQTRKKSLTRKPASQRAKTAASRSTLEPSLTQLFATSTAAKAKKPRASAGKGKGKDDAQTFMTKDGAAISKEEVDARMKKRIFEDTQLYSRILRYEVRCLRLL